MFLHPGTGLKHNEIKERCCYRTKEWVLGEYDRMAAAAASGVPYESTLKKKPGGGNRHPATQPPGFKLP